MRLLIYILALTSAFFVSANVQPDLTDLKPPKLETGLHCFKNDYITSCHAVFQTGFDNACELALPSYPMEPTEIRIPESNYCKNDSIFIEGFLTEAFGGDPYRSEVRLRTEYISTNEQYTCPPADFPDYSITVSRPTESNPTAIMCAKELDPEPDPEKDCPAGYHSKAVSKAMGSDSCMPKECPASGSGEDLYSGKMAGGVPFDGGGMYCNDGCAYSVKSENITSDQYALGISQGAACGDKPYDDKKLSEEGDEGQCETNTVDGVTIMFCNNEPAPPTDKDDDANNDGSKEDETEKPKKDLEDCASDDNACMLRNLIKEQSNNTQVQIENDNKLHNKMVDTATNNTNVLKTAIDDLHTTVFVGLQKNDKLEAVKASKINDLISAVREGNQILTDKPIGGGGGGGNGGGDGEGEGGGDCEGGAADCVPIAGSEIPKEIVNLSQYADKYDDWLPNAELPDEKCIVLTTGQSLCFSFSAFIILFQAISGLIVISSLLHSARIIAGAI